eukprot:m.22276 g.22276  ORF g.22276 m.22276 type:complete len:655 (+) comp8372_c0_seq2:89-2053(+)
METDIQARFATRNVTVSDGRIINQCAVLSNKFGLSAESFVDKWLAYAYNAAKGSDTPTKSALSAFAKELARQETPSKSPIQPPNAMTSASAPMLSRELLAAFQVGGSTAAQILEAAPQVTPRATQRRSIISPSAIKRKVGGFSAEGPPPQKSELAALPESPESKTYGTRDQAGFVMQTFNPQQRPLKPMASRERQELVIKPLANCLHDQYSFMFEKLNDKAAVLDEQLDDMGRKIVKRHKIKDEESGEPVQFAHVAMAAQDPTYICGRIDVDALSGKINSSSILLEGSSTTSSGRRIPLTFAPATGYSIFPGQMIGVRGVNPTGHGFVADTIYQGAPAPLRKIAPKELIDTYYSRTSSESQALDIFVAAGPFTPTSNLDYEPLRDLLQQVSEEKPDVLILLGPFASTEHPLADTMERTFEEQYKGFVDEIAQVVLADEDLKHTHVVIIPSMQDGSHDFIFPQAPIQVMEHERIHYYPNPAMFMVQELLFGVTSTDVLFHLSKQEFSRGADKDRMVRLVNHLFEQQSFYPMFPPDKSTPVDYTRSEAFHMQKKPDVLLTPSNLRQFVKDVNGTLVVNPGSLTKHSLGGSYARLVVHAPRRIDIPDVSAARLIAVNFHTLLYTTQRRIHSSHWSLAMRSPLSLHHASLYWIPELYI